jgi:sec-independent protein translocase protein TatA
MNFGTTEIILIVAVLFLLFGATRLPQLAKSLGQSRKAFKDGMREAEEEAEKEAKQKQLASNAAAPQINAMSGDDEVVAEMRRSAEVLAALAVVAAEAGDAARARELLAELEHAAASRYVSPALTATVRAALGDLDGAFADLHRAIDVRAAEVIWFEMRKSYARLREDPRFAEIRARRVGERIVAERTRA